MRFRRLHAKVFGPLRGRDLDLGGDVVLVFGRNESGKSSFRTALETILYGFEPAEREKHPLHQWDGGAGGDLHVEADLELGTGEIMRVERVLQATGKLRTAGAGEDFEGRRQGNRALGVMEGLPRELYQTIYSVELEQLEALRKSVQAHVDDLLLPETEALGVRPVSEIREELRRDHQSLWRADRRGKTRTQALRDELSAARARADEAARTERELRDARAQRARLETELEDLRARKRTLERARDDAPYLRELFDLNRRKREMGSPVDLSLLGDLPLIDPAALASEIEEIEKTRIEPADRMARQEETLGDREEAVLAAAGDIDLALAAAPTYAAESARFEEAQARAHSLREEARRNLAGVLTESADSETLENAGALPLESLRAAQISWASAWERRASEPRSPARLPGWALALGAGGLALIALAAFLEPRLAVLGAVLAFGAMAGAVLARGREQRADAMPARPGQIDAALRGLLVAPGLLARPAELQRLIETLDRVQRALGEEHQARDTADRLRDTLQHREAEWGSLCRRLGLDEAGTGEQCIARLRTALARAREQEKRVSEDRNERRLARQALDSSRPALERKLSHLSRIEETLRTAEPEAPDIGARYVRVRERRDEAEYVRKREAELRTDPRWSTLERDPRVLGEEVPDAADWLPEVTERREREIAALERDIEAANTRLGEFASLLGSQQGSQQARAHDAVCAVEESLREVERERDRLALLESIFARAELDYRDQHQPDVMRRASAYLDRVTRGRYSRLDYLAGADEGLHVVGAGRAEPIRVGHPISRGTLDQIFLCLRLALLDHLDEERETLPLVLDDALVRMDDARRAEVYRLLGEISPRRQILLLTCHEKIADEAEEALKVQRINL